MELISGVIQGDKKEILFSVPKGEFQFCFLTNTIMKIGKEYKATIVSPKDGLIYGKTHDNRNISIYVGDSDFEVYGCRIMNVPAYIISKGNIRPDGIKEFDEISFGGGTINRAFCINGMQVDYSKGQPSITTDSDCKELDITIDGELIHLNICSVLSIKSGFSGKSIENSNVKLTMSFKNRQPVSSFWKYYDSIIRLLSFLTFRKNVGFESIELILKNREMFPAESADVFIRHDDELTKKEYVRSIGIDFVWNNLSNILRAFMSEAREKEPLLGFLPSDDKDISIMTSSKIRDICSSIEREYNLTQKSLLLEEVKRRRTYKNAEQERKGEKKRSKMTLEDIIAVLYGKYKDKLQSITEPHICVDDLAIKEFVKYRNDITHGNSARILKERVAVTAYALMGLIYCSILSRMELPDETVCEIVKRKVCK